MKITVQAPNDEALRSIVFEAEGEAETYQLASISRTLEMHRIKFHRWSNENGRGITVGILKS